MLERMLNAIVVTTVLARSIATAIEELTELVKVTTRLKFIKLFANV